jgi:hypothetical protein
MGLVFLVAHPHRRSNEAAALDAAQLRQPSVPLERLGLGSGYEACAPTSKHVPAVALPLWPGADCAWLAHHHCLQPLVAWAAAAIVESTRMR